MSRHTTTHRFVLVLDGVGEPDDALEDALYDANCSDALLAFRNRVGYLEFDRNAASGKAAILSAIRDVERSNHPVRVSHVEPDDLVSAAEIARRLGRTREYVRLLVRGERGGGGFPSPISGVLSKTSLWSWVDVVRWARQQELADAPDVETATFIRNLNAALRDRVEPTAARDRKGVLKQLDALAG